MIQVQHCPAPLTRVAFITLVLSFLVVGCGGGGGTSTGGGNTAASASSTIVLQVSKSNVAAFLEPQTRGGPWRSIIAAGADLLIPPAFAQSADIEVFLDGVSVGFVEEGGTIMFPATAGFHEITLNNGTITRSFNVDVPADTIVTISDVRLDSDQLSFGQTKIDDGTSDRSAHKTKICHKGRKTLSVGNPAVRAHLAHGDHLGPCHAAQPVASDSSDGSVQIVQQDDQVVQQDDSDPRLDNGRGNGNGSGRNGNRQDDPDQRPGNGRGNGNGRNGNRL